MRMDGDSVRRCSSGLLTLAFFALVASSAAAQTPTIVSALPDGTPVGGTTPAMSADGRYVAFMSEASNLVPGDDNGAPDLFVKDVVTGAITRHTELATSIALSTDGRYIGFEREFVHRLDRTTGEVDRSVGRGRWAGVIAMSADGRVLLWTEPPADSGPDTSEDLTIFALDLDSGQRTMVGRPACIPFSGYSGCNPTGVTLSANGRYVAFVDDDRWLSTGFHKYGDVF